MVRNVSVLGNKRFDTARLDKDLKLRGGQYFDQNQQNIDLQKLRDEYGGDGFVFAKIAADNRLDAVPGTLDIVYNIEEGARYRVGRINIQIKGENPHTQVFTVINRLSFAPGDIADTREFLASERRLKAAQLFKVEPQKGVEPKIVYSPPVADGGESAVAGGQRRTTYYCVPGGQAPLPPGEGYLDLNIAAGTLVPESEEPGRPQPTYQGETLPPTPTATEMTSGQAYPPATYAPQNLQPSVRFTTRYEPADGWTQPQPPSQGQSWPPATSGNSGGYPAAPAQNYTAAPQPQGTMYYTPPATADNNVAASPPFGPYSPAPLAGYSAPPAGCSAGRLCSAGRICSGKQSAGVRCSHQ